VDAAEAAAENGEVLAENVDQATINRAPAGDDAIAQNLLLVHAEIRLAVDHQRVDLAERAFVEQQLDALAGGQLALGLARGQLVLAAAHVGLLLELSEMFNFGVHTAPDSAFSLLA